VNKSALNRLLRTWCDRTVNAADLLLEPLFESADQVLLEYADKAEDNRLQALFLEGRRVLRSDRPTLEWSFHDALNDDIFRFMYRQKEAADATSTVMSLVSKESFELSLALETISEQAHERNKALYHGLSQRLGVVSGGPAVPYETLPAGPYQLAGVFQRITIDLKIERQVLLALYTLFEQEVIEPSPPWHEELDEALKGHGILPNLKYQFQTSDSPTHSKVEPATNTGESAVSPATPGSGNEVPYGAGHATDRAANQRSTDKDSARVGQRGDSYAVSTPQSYIGMPPMSASDLPESFRHDRRSASEPRPRDANRHSQAAADARATATGDSAGDQLLGRIRELLTTRRTRISSARGTAIRRDPENPASPADVAAVIDGSDTGTGFVPPDTGVLESGVRRVVIPRALLKRMRDLLAKQREYIKMTVGEDRLSYLDEDTIDIVGMVFEAMLKDDRLSDTIKALLSYLHTPYLKLAVRDRAFLTRQEHPARCLLDNMIEAGSRWVDENDLRLGAYPALQNIVQDILRRKDYSRERYQELDEGLSAEVRLLCERQEVQEARTLETEKGKAKLEFARQEARRVSQELLVEAGSPKDYVKFIEGIWVDYLTLLTLRSNGDRNNNYWRSALNLGLRLRSFVEGINSGVMPSHGALVAARDELEQRLRDVIPHSEAETRKLFDSFRADHEIEIVAPTSLIPVPTPRSIGISTAAQQALRERLRKLPPGSWLVFRKKNEADEVAKLSWLNEKTERFLFVDQKGHKAIVVPLNELVHKVHSQQAIILPATGESYIASTLSQVSDKLESG
jgi:hypothetical protein